MSSSDSSDLDSRHRSKKYRHRSKSRSRDRSRDRKHSKRERSRESERSKDRDRSRDEERYRKRSRSRDRSKGRERSSTNHSRSKRREKDSKEKSSRLHQTKPREDKIQKALKSAAANDDELRVNRTIILDETMEEQQSRIDRINEIESGDFVQNRFKSNRGDIPLPKGSQIDSSHATAMFSVTSLPSMPNLKPPPRQPDMDDPLQLIHPSLLVNGGEKIRKWKMKLQCMREKAARRRFV